MSEPVREGAPKDEQPPKNLEEMAERAGIDTSGLKARQERIKMDVFGVDRLLKHSEQEQATEEDGLRVATEVEALIAQAPRHRFDINRRPDGSVTWRLPRDDRDWYEGVDVVSQPYERPTADTDGEYTYLAAIQDFRIETDHQGDITAAESLNVDRELKPHVSRKLFDHLGRVTGLATIPASRTDVADATREMHEAKARRDAHMKAKQPLQS